MTPLPWGGGQQGQGDGGAKVGVEEVGVQREVGDPVVLVYKSAQQAHTLTKYVPGEEHGRIYTHTLVSWCRRP